MERSKNKLKVKKLSGTCFYCNAHQEKEKAIVIIENLGIGIRGDISICLICFKILMKKVEKTIDKDIEKIKKERMVNNL